MEVYIDREQAIKCLDGSVLITRQSEAEAVREYFEMVIKRLENLPTIDLVRCGECKHKIQALSTEKGATGCELISGTFYEDFFCKEGERGANDEDIDPYQGERDRDENGEIY